MITVPTGELTGILADAIPFASKDETLPMLNSVRVEWDGEQLHALSTDRYRIAWATWHPDDDPPTDVQADLFTTWGSGDDPWGITLDLGDAKDIVSNYKLGPKEYGCPLNVDHEGEQLRIVRSRETGYSAITMVVRGGGGLDVEQQFPDVRKLLAGNSTAVPAREAAYNAKLLADFAKVRQRGPLRMTFTGENKPTLVHIGERFTGAIMPVKEGGE